jgi:hypothetical protein
MARRKKPAETEGGGEPAVSVVAHPRARRSIRRLRAGAGLIGLIGVTVLSLRAGVPEFDAVLRGLAGGVAAHFVAWLAGIVAWRHLVLGELIAHREAHEARVRELHEEARRRASEALAAHAANTP